MQTTVIQIQICPDQLSQLGELIRGAVRQELNNYTPPVAEGPPLPEILTRQQTADALHISLSTLHEWGKDTADRPAILVSHRINGRVRYRRADVLAALKESRRFKSTQPA